MISYNNVIKTRKEAKNMAKYCYYDSKNKVYHIRKRINGKQQFFGTYPNEEEASLAVKLFEKTGWKKEDNWAIKAKVKEIFRNKEADKNGASRI